MHSTIWLIGHPKAMSISNHAQQKAVCGQKGEVDSTFSGVDPPQLAEVKQRWDQSWSQSGSPTKMNEGETYMGLELVWILNSGQKVQPK